MLVYLAFAFVLITVCLAQTSSSICPSCSFSQNMTMVRIPEPMTLEDYHDYIVNHTWSEIYYVLRNPPPWPPWYNYKMTFQPVSGGISVGNIVADEYTGTGLFTFGRKVVTENEKPTKPKVDGICRQITTTLELMIPSTDGTTLEARFFRPSTDSLIIFSSSCPSKYFWMFKCDVWNSTHCEQFGSELALEVKDQGYFDTMKDMPLVSMMTDLRRETGIIFGNEDFAWFWTAGDSKFCS